MKERKLVLVFWEDITSTDTNWREEEDAMTWADEVDSIVRQTGFLISKDNDYLVLACSYIPKLELIGSVIRIPISTIKHYQEFEFESFKDIS